MSEFVSIDLMPMLAGVLASCACALLGSFLLLRRISLMGDAISHSVLPGLVGAFLLVGTRDPLVMLAGAAGAGVVSVLLIELIRRVGRVEPGAATGVVFSVMFALGVLLMKPAAERVDLDADCVLHGQLESLFWFPGKAEGEGVARVGSVLALVPRQVVTLLIVLGVCVLFVLGFFKELRLSAFDPDLSTSLGVHAGAMHFALALLVAVATVASFEAVGSILVVAMFICPPACARMLTDRLSTQVWLSVVIAGATGVAGYIGGALLPNWLGYANSLSAAGSITVVSGAVFVLCALLGPRHGVIARLISGVRLSRRVRVEDVISSVFRAGENGGAAVATAELLEGRAGVIGERDIRRAESAGLLNGNASGWELTALGRERAIAIIRRHRLWERYLVDRAGMRPDHVHDPAELLEHVAGAEPSERWSVDPHDRPIPG